MKKKVMYIVILSLILGVGLLVREQLNQDISYIARKAQGQGSSMEELEVEVDGMEESLRFEVAEQEYTEAEVEVLFAEVMEELDEIILGENESLDRVEYDLNLVRSLEDYPVQISWELDSYKVMDMDGNIQEADVVEEGTLVELRGNISYLGEEVIYVRNAMIYPRTLEGEELLFSEIKKAVQSAEEGSRKEKGFALPTEINGKALSWKTKATYQGVYVIVLGIVLAAFLVYRQREDKRKEKERRHAELIREYPGMISKLNMLLGTGMTVKHAWETIVTNYVNQREALGVRLVYEEMALTLNEMQGGISEGEAYERFGKRCELTPYLKLGALLSQNLRKGSRGISDLLRVEAIQSFENRKNLAKQKGEEAGTKLMLPMIGMLAVVMIMVMVPAFLTMQF